MQGFVALVPPIIEAATARGPSGHYKQANNVTMKEDEMLHAAYLNVNKDPTICCNQPSGGY
jgi:hypothetical protein